MSDSPDTTTTLFERRMITTTVMLGALMAIVDTSIINVSLPAIGENLHASVDELSMIATGFIIAGVIVTPLVGWLNAFLGRQRFFMTVLGVFIAASIACGLAWDVESLTLFRFLQGLGGGALIPSSQAILLESSPREQHGRAMAAFGLVVMVGPAMGPVLGGWITETFSWHWIFFINIPIGLAALWLAFRFLHTPPGFDKPTGRFDWPGLVTMVVALVSIQLVLEKGRAWGGLDSGWVLALSGLGLLALGLFIAREWRTPHPVVDLSVMRERLFLLASMMSIVLGFGLFGILVILPLFLEDVMNFSPMTIGLSLFPGAVATGLTIQLAGRLADRIDPRIPILTGILTTIAGMFMFAALPAGSGYWDVFWPQVVRGVGIGMLFVPLTTLAMREIPMTKISGATGLYTLIRQLGGSFGIAILASMVASTHQRHAGSLPAYDALHHAYVQVFHFTAYLFIGVLPLLLFMKARKPGGSAG